MRRKFRDLSVTLPEFDCTIMGELSGLLHGCVLVRTKEVDPAHNKAIRPDQIGPVVFHQSVPAYLAFVKRPAQTVPRGIVSRQMEFPCR
jgi:hypothetical protein